MCIFTSKHISQVFVQYISSFLKLFENLLLNLLTIYFDQYQTHRSIVWYWYTNCILSNFQMRNLSEFSFLESWIKKTNEIQSRKRILKIAHSPTWEETLREYKVLKYLMHLYSKPENGWVENEGRKLLFKTDSILLFR